MTQENQVKKNFLLKAFRLDEEIRLNQEELDNLRELSTTLKGLDYSQTKVQISGSGDASFVHNLNKLSDIELKICTKINELKEVRAHIWEAIYTLENANERLVCLYKYLKFYSWEQVAYKMHLSDRQVKRIHGFALNHIKI